MKVTGSKEPLLFTAEQCVPVYDANNEIRHFSTCEADIYMRDGNDIVKIHEFRIAEEADVGGGFLSVEQSGYLIEKRSAHKILFWEMDAEKEKLVLTEEYNKTATNSEMQTGLDRFGEATRIKFSYFKPGQEL